MSYKNLVIKQGESWTEPVLVLDGIGNPLNLTNYTTECILRRSFASKSYTVIVVTINDASAGTLTLSLTAGETAAFRSGRYVYALRVTSNDEAESFVLDGIVTVEASALRTTVG